MATVTGLTSARMLAIEAESIVNGAIDGSGHLQLTTHGGTVIDAGAVLGSVPDASDTVVGIVELATDAEVQAGTDTTRAVTPATLASIPGVKIQTLANDAKGETATPTAYPDSFSLMVLTAAGTPWSRNSGNGLVVTNNVLAAGRASQWFYGSDGGTEAATAWLREYDSAGGGGGWTAWIQIASSDLSTIAGLTPANDDLIQRKSGAWTNRTMTELIVDLIAAGINELYSGTAYAVAPGAQTYIGSVDPGAVPNGSVWFDTT